MDTNLGQAAIGDKSAVLDNILGQDSAKQILENFISSPVHAYMFIGPSGTGKRIAARSFAAALLCDQGGCGVCAHCHDAAREIHRDMVIIERDGPQISVETAREVVRLAQRSPSVAKRQVIILCEFHLAEAAAAALLKTIEEPPSDTVFIILTEEITPPLVTVASRCVQIPFFPIEDRVICQILLKKGVDEELAKQVALFARGNLDRAYLLAGDENFVQRMKMWADIPDRLEMTGSNVAKAVDAILETLSVLSEKLTGDYTAEVAALQIAAKESGDKGAFNRQRIEERHKRQLRRIRTDEIRAGFAEMIHSYYGKLNPDFDPRLISRIARCVEKIEEASLALSRNPNEEILLTALLLDLAAI